MAVSGPLVCTKHVPKDLGPWLSWGWDLQGFSYGGHRFGVCSELALVGLSLAARCIVPPTLSYLSPVHMKKFRPHMEYHEPKVMLLATCEPEV